MPLRLNNAGVNLIKAFEGKRLKAYKCPAGVWTIGYGHTTAAGSPKVVPGMTVTEAEADAILRADLDVFEDGVEKLLRGVPVDEHQFAALVSLAFNIGLGAFGKSTLLMKVRAHDFDAVPAQFLRWNKAGGRVLPGLDRRRRAEVALWKDQSEEVRQYAAVEYEDMARELSFDLDMVA